MIETFPLWLVLFSHPLLMNIMNSKDEGFGVSHSYVDFIKILWDAKVHQVIIEYLLSFKVSKKT